MAIRKTLIKNFLMLVAKLTSDSETTTFLFRIDIFLAFSLPSWVLLLIKQNYTLQAQRLVIQLLRCLPKTLTLALKKLTVSCLIYKTLVLQGSHVLLPQLWSNNKVLLGLGKTIFESAWESGFSSKKC